jgi:hypothetical protein
VNVGLFQESGKSYSLPAQRIPMRLQGEKGSRGDREIGRGGDREKGRGGDRENFTGG